MLEFFINVRDNVSPKVEVLLDTLSGTGMKELNRVVSEKERPLFRNHLKLAAKTRHKWANMLGATPTRHLDTAADSVTAEHSENEAAVIIRSPGISRALGDLHIKPRTAAYLTIPAAAESYGKRAKDVKKDGWEVFRPIAKGGVGASKKQGRKAQGPFRDFLAGTKDGEFKILYWLKESVTVPQDRELLPSNEEIGATAKEAILKELDFIMEKEDKRK